MTTIAYRDGVLAADGRMSQGHTVVTDKYTKVKRIPGGLAVAGSGDVTRLAAFVDWLMGGSEGARPSLKNCDALVVYPSGKVEAFDETGSVILPKSGYYAEGSGRAFALGAMAMGADAREAVKVAARFDQGTGGRIKSITIPSCSKE